MFRDILRNLQRSDPVNGPRKNLSTLPRGPLVRSCLIFDGDIPLTYLQSPPRGPHVSWGGPNFLASEAKVLILEAD